MVEDQEQTFMSLLQRVEAGQQDKLEFATGTLKPEGMWLGWLGLGLGRVYSGGDGVLSLLLTIVAESRDLAAFLAGNGTLKKLSIIGNALSENVLRTITSWLTVNSSLTTLILRSASVTPVSAIALSDMLRLNRYVCLKKKVVLSQLFQLAK